MDEREKGFWIAIIGAVVVKLILSPSVNWVKEPLKAFTRAALTVIPAVWGAYTFTDPIIAWLQWDPESYRNAVAGLLAIVGENLIRKILNVTNSDTILVDLFNLWRGK